MKPLDSLIESTQRLRAANDALESGNQRRDSAIERSRLTYQHTLELSTRAEARAERLKQHK